MFHRRTLAAVALTALVAACATPDQAPMSVADTLSHDPSLSTLNGLVVKAGLSDMLKAQGPYTVFAPTNEAFKAVPAKAMDDLAQHPEHLKALLAYHVVPGKVMARDVKLGKAKTANGADVHLARAGDFVTVEDAMVQTADKNASNGVVHTVDRVLMPPKK
ncbi:MAG: fasciclin domain-containing protein [Ramlibacter sp.]